MVKLFILTIVIYCLFVVKNKQSKEGKNHTQDRQVLYVLHIVLGIVVTLFATFHGISHIEKLSTIGGILGCSTLTLLYVEIITGVLLYKKPVSKWNIIHKILSIIIVLCGIFHLFIN